MVTQLQFGEIRVDVVQKDIKNVHLSVYPPDGQVKIAAPLRMDIETIRVFAISKLAWIKKQQKKFREQKRETPREYINRESHYVWGKRYLLKVVEMDVTPSIKLTPRHLRMIVRPGTDQEERDALLQEWYREQIKAVLPNLITKWEPKLGVKVKRFYVQRMKTRWGSCNTESRCIRINTVLAKKPADFLEYIVVHEMLHLLVRNHGEAFVQIMDHLLPLWKDYRSDLNQSPLQ